MILVTGATGLNGRELVARLSTRGVPVRALVRTPSKAEALASLPGVEIVAGDHRDGHRISTDVGVSIVDTAAGRVLVTPLKATDGNWISSFIPGTDLAIATAVQRLTAALPDGPWFPTANLTRDFETSTAERKEHVPEHVW